MSGNKPIYSIQGTYILTDVSTPEKKIITCDHRIDIPTVEPIPNTTTVLFDKQPRSVVPCIEIVGPYVYEYDLTFETNEGVTVLPIEIGGGYDNPLENPYTFPRYVLVLPRGTTGVKSCKIIHKATGKEVQHNLTFGIMHKPYNYDNVLFGYISYRVKDNSEKIGILKDKVNALKLSTKTPTFEPIKIYKDAGKQTINIEDDVLFYEFAILYPITAEPMTHKPKITLNDGESDYDFTLSINETAIGVSIDLFTGKITVYGLIDGKILQQFMLSIPFGGFKTLSFDNFYDIRTSYLTVIPRGARVI